MTEIETGKMPWWQKAYCVAFGVMLLLSLYGMITQYLFLASHHAIQLNPTGIISCLFGPILYSFLFVTGLMHWRKNQPL